jgi:hypothetical protein
VDDSVRFIATSPGTAFLLSQVKRRYRLLMVFSSGQ